MLLLKGYGVTLHPGTRLLINSAATLAFDLPTSQRLQKNYQWFNR